MAYQIYKLTRLFNKINPDILHINNGGYPGALSARAAVIAGRLAGVPNVVMVVNNLAFDYKNFLRLPDYLVDRKISNLVDLFITGSKVSAKRLQLVLKTHDDKIRTLHNCSADRLSDEKANETLNRLGLGGFNGVIFGVVALLIPRKGHQVLFDSILDIIENINKILEIKKIPKKIVKPTKDVKKEKKEIKKKKIKKKLRTLWIRRKKKS